MNRQLLALGTSAILLAVPATADAALTMGRDPDLVVPSTPSDTCGGPSACTLAQDRLSNAPFRIPSLVVSDHAVVTRWRIHAGDGQARLRRLSPDARSGLAASAWGALPTGGGVATHVTELPVQAGDAIGVDLTAGASIAAQDLGFGSDTLLAWVPALGDGETRAGAAADGEIFLELTLEPDRDQDGRGDETHPPVQPPPPPPPPSDPPRSDPPRADPPPRTGPPRVDPPRAEDPLAKLPKAGPKATIAGRATATRRGAVALSLRNPYGFAVNGSVTVRHGGRAIATRRVRLAANATRAVSVRLGRAARRTLGSGAGVRLTVAARLRAAVGRARTTRRAVTVTASRATTPAPPTRAPPTPGDRSGDSPGRPSDEGFDGTYRAPDGLAIAVEGGVVKSFSGSLTTYCTATSRQKLVSFGMFGDDPDPAVAADGSFSYEATSGYGFVKLKYDGRISGTTASGRLVVEDRSPISTSDGRLAFDYCFAGKDWSASK